VVQILYWTSARNLSCMRLATLVIVAPITGSYRAHYGYFLLCTYITVVLF